MITVRCVNKIRNRNGFIEYYILEDFEGNTKKFSRSHLESLMKNKLINVTNLTMNLCNIIVDKDEEKDNTENIDTTYSSTDYKLKLMGLYPECDSLHRVIDVVSKNTIFTDSASTFRNSIIELNKNAEFRGTQPLKRDGSVNIKLVFNKVSISNISVIDSLGKYNEHKVMLMAKDVRLNTNINKETIIRIYNIFKNQYMIISDDESRISSIDTIRYINTIEIDVQKIKDSIGLDAYYKTVEKLVRDWKFPITKERQLMSVMSTLLFIYSSWISSGKTNEKYINLFKSVDLYTETAVNNAFKPGAMSDAAFRYYTYGETVYETYYKSIKHDIIGYIK